MPKKKTVRESIDELQTIVAGFERDDIDIEAAIAQFEKASALSSEIEKELEALKLKITTIRERFDSE